MKHHLILASVSPQRCTLLEGIGAPFTVVPSAVDESVCTETDPILKSAKLANMKAAAVAKKNTNAFVLGADTLVVTQSGIVLEKPENAADAERMLHMHSGQTSTVHTAVCLYTPDGTCEELVQSSFVHFAELSAADIQWWLQTGEWKDRSGAFQIDGKGQLLIRSIEGDWTSIVGLPVFAVGQLLRKHGLL